MAVNRWSVLQGRDAFYVDRGQNADPHSEVTVGDTSTAVFTANDKDIYRLVQNDSSLVVYLALGGTAVLNTGIRLNPNGGSYEMNGTNGNLWVGAINGITSAGGSATLLLTRG